MRKIAATKLMIVPHGYRLKEATINGTAETVLVPKIVSKKKRVTKAAKNAMKAAARKIKVPVITTAAQLPWAIPTAGYAYNAITKRRTDDAIRAGDSVLSAFTGVRMKPKAAGSWDFDVAWEPLEMIRGLVPNGIAWGINKVGIFRGTNQKLAKTRLPFRLS